MSLGTPPGAVAVIAALKAKLDQVVCVADVAAAVRQFGRRMIDADGITFVLRDGPNCYYMDEDAISPLWKGHRFPLETCISGWVMMHRQAVIIPDVFADGRVPHEVYRRTFVKSLMMVPVGDPPVAAIGCYWAEYHDPADTEALALFRLSRAASEAMDRLPAAG